MNKVELLEKVIKAISTFDFPKIKEEQEVKEIFKNEFLKVYERHDIIKNMENKNQIVSLIVDLISQKKVYSEEEGFKKEIADSIIKNINDFMRTFDGNLLTAYLNHNEILKVYNAIFKGKILNDNDELIIKWSDVSKLYSSSGEETDLKNQVNTDIIKNIKLDLQNLSMDSENINSIVYGNKQIVNQFVRNFYAKINEGVKAVIMRLCLSKYMDSTNQEEQNRFAFNLENKKDIKEVIKLFNHKKNDFSNLVEIMYEKKKKDLLIEFFPKYLDNCLQDKYFSLADLSEILESETSAKYLKFILSEEESKNKLIYAINNCDYFYSNVNETMREAISVMWMKEIKAQTLKDLRLSENGLVVEPNVLKTIYLDNKKLGKISQRIDTHAIFTLIGFEHPLVEILANRKYIVISFKHECSNLVNDNKVGDIILGLANEYGNGKINMHDVYSKLSIEIDALFLQAKLDSIDTVDKPVYKRPKV